MFLHGYLCKWQKAQGVIQLTAIKNEAGKLYQEKLLIKTKAFNITLHC